MPESWLRRARRRTRQWAAALLWGPALPLLHRWCSPTPSTGPGVLQQDCHAPSVPTAPEAWWPGLSTNDIHSSRMHGLRSAAPALLYLF